MIVTCPAGEDHAHPGTTGERGQQDWSLAVVPARGGTGVPAGLTRDARSVE